jgi:hypothetical protein
MELTTELRSDWMDERRELGMAEPMAEVACEAMEEMSPARELRIWALAVAPRATTKMVEKRMLIIVCVGVVK